ncbi:primary-amine oxidase [Saccharopolyspora antimicrobica]|uniref:Amine oxidase n=1 Tax=Saccharopolyspora antimicrobica TaxID=455193 RepID=A0A1I5M6G8_9PSEU|nr:primary-amine oxidase [Saccharopolyspora antimicrobica]RKT82077.1 primary-amine oxidase [Saccharopolyspora antimicrobica]SFP05238.1 primary-amine oxidase [Saccharopolyspora antimicrobica]
MTMHPLEPLSEAEFLRNREILQQAGLLHESTRFPLVQLAEPDKASVLAHRDGDPVDRRARSVLLDVGTGELTTTVVSLTSGEVVDKAVVDPAEQGQPPVMLDEYELVERIVRADETWQRAIRERGFDDISKVRVCPLSAGWFGTAEERGRRMLRALAFAQDSPEELPWAHPIDGLVAYVDVIERRVLEVVDDRKFPVPQESGDYSAGPHRDSLRPIEITQPDGPSFQVDGHEVRWENWRFRIGFDPREGLVLHQLSFRDGDRERPVIYRASIAEMVVNYGDPSPVRFWQNYFDAGEYAMGKLANELVLGCDCLGEIRYFDAVVAQEDGTPRTLRNAVCMHEEDAGVLWKHTDVFTGSAETRRQRRLVVSFFVSVGNYDYGFYWYLYLDGTIQLETKATGIVFTSAYSEEGSRWAGELAPGVGGPYHQHLFSARLDMMVDGTRNAVDEIEAQRVPIGPDNPHGNAFTRSVTRLARESDAGREANPTAGRTWHVVNTERTNRLGQPVGYALHPQGYPALLADPESSIAKRAAFATKHLWVTQYDQDERYPAGEWVNQSHGGAGILAFTAADRGIDGEDIVLWHTFGLTHFPRSEDWPIMPVDLCGFTLKPVGFFDRNPTLDVPPSTGTGSHCCES